MDVEGEPVEAEVFDQAFGDFGETVEAVGELGVVGMADRPKPMWSGATRWYSSAKELIRLRNMWELDGKPCSNSNVGLFGSPASR